MTDQSIPEAQWSPGYGHITPGRWIRLWTRDHAPYDVASRKGPARSTGIAVTAAVNHPDGGVVIDAYRRDNVLNAEPMPTLHGDRFATADDAYRALFDAGWVAYEETVRVAPLPGRITGRRRTEDDTDPDWTDVDPRIADGNAADMVYGRSR